MSAREAPRQGWPLGLLAVISAYASLAALVPGCRDGSSTTTATTPTGVGGITADAGRGGSAGAQPDGGTPAGATLMTWNLETFPLSPQTGTFVSDTLDSLQPDLVAVQDIAEASAFASFAADLPGYDGLLNDDPGAFLRVGLLHRTDRVVISDVETLFPSDWYGFPRPPLKVRAEITPESGVSFDFVLVVVHLKAQLDSESQDRRRAACDALDGWIRAQLAAGSEQDIVVAGDFNDELTDPPSWNVFGPFLEAPSDYAFLTLPLEQAGGHTYIPFDSFIDHVLVTSDTLVEYGSGTTEALALEQSSPEYEVAVSDHRPVLVRFGLDR